MSDFDKSAPGRVIQISREEAESDHVNDLLQRQRAMRGEKGIARSTKKRWYYQNWLIFMIVGTLGALAAWAIVEPYFDDSPYVKVKIDKIVRASDFFNEIGLSADNPKTASFMVLKFDDFAVIVPDEVRKMPEGDEVPSSELGLEEGQEVGIYVQDVDLPDGGGTLLVAQFIDPHPAPAKNGKEPRDLKSANKLTFIMSLLLFPLTAGLVGLLLGATDGIICRQGRRAALCGVVGLLSGLLGGTVSMLVGGLIYSLIRIQVAKNTGDAAGGLSTVGFMMQMGGRGLAWLLAGMAMGLGQGIALRSKRLLAYGFLGGIIGGLFGGLLFDPIDLLLAGDRVPSAHLSRLVGLLVIGATVGLMIGVVELLARDSWLQMIQGPLAGKEFLIFKDIMYVGSSPRSDIYVFNDPEVAASHAVIRQQGEETELESLDPEKPATINGRDVKRQKLRHGDKVALGRTIFVYQTKQA